MTNKSLFKYKSINNKTFERDFDFLERNKIWFSKIETLNDPYEAIYTQNFAEHLIWDKILRKNNGFGSLYFAKQEFIKIQNKLLGVLSLTSDNKNLLMWSHYADNHKGYIVEYDFSEDCFTPIGEHKNYKIKIRKINVEYSKQPKIRSIFDKIDYNQLNNKSIWWEYEKEQRFVSNYYGSYEYHYDCLKAIYLGANCTPEIETKFIEFCTKNNKPLFKAKISEHKFEISYEKIL